MAADKTRHPDPSLLALGIKQPWAELILRGIKTLEIRSQPTQVRGTVYVYASRSDARGTWAEQAITRWQLESATLPRGVLVGTVRIIDVRPFEPQDEPLALIPSPAGYRLYAWVLSDPQRLVQPLPVRFLPYGVWFYPYKRKQTGTISPAGHNECS
ncbi:MAG: hypothetical protein KatS3mg113_0646 [Planctomycetaceae bacterium]|nr:MAG: hypothetical protein KatS3mg113_0646 [Planctomycetaceae bacterium]